MGIVLYIIVDSPFPNTFSCDDAGFISHIIVKKDKRFFGGYTAYLLIKQGY
jgi:hypothetical protein